MVFNMSMSPDEYSIKEIENTILLSYDALFGGQLNYTDEECLLKLRKSILNHHILQHQAEILPAIIEFNNALRNVLLEMHDRAHRIWNDVKKQKRLWYVYRINCRMLLGS